MHLYAFHFQSIRISSFNTKLGLADSSSALAINDVAEIASRYKIVKFGQADVASSFELELVDPKFAIKIEKIRINRENGIGLILDEYQKGKTIGGVVLVGDLKEKASKAGFLKGDCLVSIEAATPITEAPQGQIRVEGLNYDATIKELSRFGDVPELIITIKRLVKRKYIDIEVVGPQGEAAGEFHLPAGFGANLRSLLDKENFRIYDNRMARFDSPYQTGNCGGEGTCGTCMVNILEGKEFLNNRVTIEEKALMKEGHPASWRWSCRTKFKSGTNASGKVKIMLRPQTRNWDQ